MSLLAWTDKRRGEERAKEGLQKPEKGVQGARKDPGMYEVPGDMVGRGVWWLDWGENGDRHWHTEKQYSWGLCCSGIVRFKIMV